MSKKNIIIFANILFFLIFDSNLSANNKVEIIKNFNAINTLKFDFVQKSFGDLEEGICYLKRPHFLKCSYNDKNKKELIINKRFLVIYHKRYNKIYNYPLSRSYFLEILDAKKFSGIIMKSKIKMINDFFEIQSLDEKKGEILFYFNKNYDLVGWKLIDINNNITLFEINNQSKNIEIKKDFFLIPEENQ